MWPGYRSVRLPHTSQRRSASAGSLQGILIQESPRWTLEPSRAYNSASSSDLCSVQECFQSRHKKLQKRLPSSSLPDLLLPASPVPAAFPVQIQVRIPEEYFQSPSLKSVAFSSHISITLPFSYLLQLNIPTLTAYKALSRNVRSSSVLFQDLRHLPVYRLW